MSTRQHDGDHKYPQCYAPSQDLPDVAAISCQQVREVIADMAKGQQIPRNHYEIVEEHLKVCPKCDEFAKQRFEQTGNQARRMGLIEDPSPDYVLE
ncbi:MAG: hypothetical protein Q7S37_04485 [bacterium]|nr:hypothetical protein [bacterium]